MTIVLQHKFWDLTVLQDRFEVKLAFNGIPEKLVVPYAALKVFFDPSVRFGHQFDEPDQAGGEMSGENGATSGRSANTAGRAGTRSAMSAPRLDKKRSTAARKRPEIVSNEPDVDMAAVPKAPVEQAAPPVPAAQEPAEHAGAKVVSLDKFRKK